MHICKNMIAEVKVFPYRLSVVLGAVRSSSSPPFQLVFIFSKLFTEITYYFSIINKRERVFCLPVSQKKFEAMLGMIRAGLGRRQNVGGYRAEDMGLQASRRERGVRPSRRLCPWGQQWVSQNIPASPLDPSEDREVPQHGSPSGSESFPASVCTLASSPPPTLPCRLWSHRGCHRGGCRHHLHRGADLAEDVQQVRGTLGFRSVWCLQWCQDERELTGEGACSVHGSIYVPVIKGSNALWVLCGCLVCWKNVTVTKYFRSWRSVFKI